MQNIIKILPHRKMDHDFDAFRCSIFTVHFEKSKGHNHLFSTIALFLVIKILKKKKKGKRSND